MRENPYAMVNLIKRNLADYGKTLDKAGWTAEYNPAQQTIYVFRDWNEKHLERFPGLDPFDAWLKWVKESEFQAGVVIKILDAMGLVAYWAGKYQLAVKD